MTTLAPPQHPSRRPSGAIAQSSSSPKVSSQSSVGTPAASPGVNPKVPRLPVRSPPASPSASFQLTLPAMSTAQSEPPVILNTPLQSTPPDGSDARPRSHPIAPRPPRHPDHHPVNPAAPHLSPSSELPPRSPENVSPLLPPPQRLQDLDEGLSEVQLRQLYENEEIERFFSLFKAHVSEVRLPGAFAKDPIVQEALPFEAIAHEDIDGLEDDAATVFVPDTPKVPPGARSSASLSRPPVSLSEKIAFEYVLPHLAPSPSPSPAFTLGRFKLTVQRLYIIADEGYLPFLLHMKRLACWEDYTASSQCCAVFWVLWLLNLLLPAFFLYLAYVLLRRRLLSYPTLAELREHRRKVDHAQEFGNQLQARLLSPSSFGPKDVWRLAKLLPKLAKSKPKTSEKEKEKLGEKEETRFEGDVYTDEDVLFPLEESQEERDLKKLGLRMMTELADFHERLKNIFLWRQPSSSKAAVVIALVLFGVTLMLPAKYLAKLVYFAGGFAFWHIIPVLNAIPSSELSRIPIPLHQVPTDTDVAMELISQRVAHGLPVLPAKARQRSHSPEDTMQDSDRPGGVRWGNDGKERSVDWKKLGGIVASGKTWASGKKQVPTANRNSVTGQVETHTFPAQHSSGPGLITVTTEAFFFTSVASSSPKITIPADSVTGIKKSGLLKGLTITWMAPTIDTEVEEKTEVFRWVGGRDEVFARLLGTNGRKWVKS